MKLSFLLLTLSLVALFCYGQTNDDKAFFSNSYDKKTVKDNNIDTAFVTINFSDQKTQRLYAFDNLGNLTYTATFGETGNKTSESVLKYNAQGQLVSRKDKEEMIDGNTSYFYNASGQLQKAITKNKKNETITVTYTYEKQKLVEETRRESTGKLVTKYKYDKQNRLIDLTILSLQGNDTKGTVSLHKTFSYDSYGNKSLEEVTDFSKETVVFQYDERKKLTLVKKGKDVEKYSYNDRGLLIQKDVIKFLVDTPMTYSEKYRYVVRK